MSVTRVTTAKGLALNAKIQAGGGDVKLYLMEVLADAGRSEDLLNLEDAVDPRLKFIFEEKKAVEAHAKIRLLLTNQGNPMADPPIPPLENAFSMQQICWFAEDPDEGRILYQVHRFELSPDNTGIPYVPAAAERVWTYNPTVTITISDAGVVTIVLDPDSLASRQSIWNSIELSDLDVPSTGVRAHLRIVEQVNYQPFNFNNMDDFEPDEDLSAVTEGDTT